METSGEKAAAITPKTFFPSIPHDVNVTSSYQDVYFDLSALWVESIIYEARQPVHLGDGWEKQLHAVAHRGGQFTKRRKITTPPTKTREKKIWLHSAHTLLGSDAGGWFPRQPAKIPYEKWNRRFWSALLSPSFASTRLCREMAIRSWQPNTQHLKGHFTEKQIFCT